MPQLSSGGGERFVVDLCNELVEMGHEVKLIVSHSLERPGLAFYLPELDKRVELESMNKRMGADFGLPVRMLRSIRRFRPDVVHTHLNGIVYSALSALRAGRVVHCHTVHNAAEKEAGASFLGRGVRRLLFKSKRVLPVTISEESQRSFREFYGMDAPMIANGRNVPQPVPVSDAVRREVEALKRTPHTRVLVNLARIISVKRQDLIARVCKRLESDGYDFLMMFIGRSIDDEVVRGIKDAECGNVHMLGERTNPLEYLAVADSFCLMSEYEGMPISLIEAIGCGCVPVCTPVGGLRNVIVDGENGFLASDLSEDACYVALKRFLDLTDEELAKRKKAAVTTYAPYGMRTCAEQYLKLFESQKC